MRFLMLPKFSAGLGLFAALSVFGLAWAGTGRGDVASSDSIGNGPSSAHSRSSGAAKPTEPKLFAQSYGSWVYRCVQVTPEGKSAVTSCQVVQEMVLHRKGHTVPLVTLAFAKEGDKQPGYVLNAVTPLGVLLPPGVSFWADDQSPVTAVLDVCEANGCLALRQPSEGLTAELRDGKQGHAKLSLLNGHTVTVNFSLNGFSDALAALDKGALPPAVKMPSAAQPRG